MLNDDDDEYLFIITVSPQCGLTFCVGIIKCMCDGCKTEYRISNEMECGISYELVMHSLPETSSPNNNSSHSDITISILLFLHLGQGINNFLVSKTLTNGGSGFRLLFLIKCIGTLGTTEIQTI